MRHTVRYRPSASRPLLRHVLAEKDIACREGCEERQRKPWTQCGRSSVRKVVHIVPVDMETDAEKLHNVVDCCGFWIEKVRRVER
jgi:hypothetical protein